MLPEGSIEEWLEEKAKNKTGREYRHYCGTMTIDLGILNFQYCPKCKYVVNYHGA